MQYDVFEYSANNYRKDLIISVNLDKYYYYDFIHKNIIHSQLLKVGSDTWRRVEFITFE